MRKVLVRCFLAVIILAVATAIGAGWALNSPWVGMKILRKLIEQPSSGMRVESLSILRQTYSWPGRFRWEGVKLSIERKGKPIRLDSPEVTLDRVDSLLTDNHNLAITVKDGDIAYAGIEAKSMQGQFTLHLGLPDPGRAEGPRWTIKGPAQAAVVTWDKWKGNDFHSLIACDSQSIGFGNLGTLIFGGSVSGTVSIAFADTAYSADIDAYGIEIARLADISGTLAKKLSGTASGHILVTGHGALMDSIETDWAMQEGSKVDAALLSAILQYIPKQSQERKRLDVLIKKGGLLPVEVLKLKMRSDNPRHLGGEVTLKSRKVNLELNVTTDINTDGRLSSLLDITSGAW